MLTMTTAQWQAALQTCRYMVPPALLALLPEEELSVLAQLKVYNHLTAITSRNTHNIEMAVVSAIRAELYAQFESRVVTPGLQGANRELLMGFSDQRARYEELMYTLTKKPMLQADRVHPADTELDGSFQKALASALEEPTMLDALNWLAIWEYERSHQSFVKSGNREICFRYVFLKLLEKFNYAKPQR